MVTKTVAAGAFKQGCLAMLDEVSKRQVEIIVTKRGRPVARVVPVADESDRESGVLARLRAAAPRRVSARDSDLTAPTSALARWSAVPRRQR